MASAICRGLFILVGWKYRYLLKEFIVAAESRREIERIVAEELPATAPLAAVPQTAKQKLRDLISLFEQIIEHAQYQLLNGNLRYRTADKAVEAIDRMSKLKLEALRYMDDLDDGNVGDADLRAFSDRVSGAIDKLKRK